MILQDFGVLSTAQDLTSGSTTDSENVILMAAVDWTALTDLWWVVTTETVATGDASDTYAFVLYCSAESTLDTNIQVASVTVTGYESYPVAGTDRHIVNMNIGQQIHHILGTGLSDYPYLGMISSISSGATISINAAISPSPGQSNFNTQVIRSNVSVPS
jgi:hypothetical protein